MLLGHALAAGTTAANHSQNGAVTNMQIINLYGKAATGYSVAVVWSCSSSATASLWILSRTVRGRMLAYQLSALSHLCTPCLGMFWQSSRMLHTHRNYADL